MESFTIENTLTNYNSIEKTNNPVDDILLHNHPSQVLENNLEEGVFEKTPTNLNSVENETPIKKKKNRGDILKLNKDTMKKQKNFSLTDESIKLLQEQCVYFHKNLSDTLETIIKNSAEEIKRKKDKLEAVKEIDYKELLEQQAQFIEQLSDEIESLKLAFEKNKAQHFSNMKNVGATFATLNTEIVKIYEVKEMKKEDGTIKYSCGKKEEVE